MRRCVWLVALAACGEVGSQAELTVEAAGGTVTSTPSGIACPGTCSAEFDFGAEVTLSATPDATMSFTGWSDACAAGRGACALTLDKADTTVAANFAPQGAKRWLVTAGAAESLSGSAHAMSSGANFVIIGSTQRATTIGGQPIAEPGQFVARLDAGTGQVAFAKSLGSLTIQAAVVDTAGNVIIAGDFRGSTDFGGGSVSSRGESDGFIAKYNADGVYQWAVPIGGSTIDFARAVGVDANGDVFVGGTFSGTVNFGGGLVTAAGATTTHDMFIARYRGATGAYVWAKRFGNDGLDHLDGLAIDRDGAVIIGGSFSGGVAFDTTTLFSDMGSPSGMLVKLDPTAGAVQFAKGVAHGTPVLATDRAGNILVAGNKPQDGSAGGPPLPGSFFVAKYSPAGAHVWSHGFAIPMRQIAADSLGDVVITEAFTDPLDLGDGVVLTSAGGQDGFVAKLRSETGATVWGTRFGGTEFDGASGLTIDALDRICVTGSFAGFAEFGGETVRALGNSDLYAIGLEP